MRLTAGAGADVAYDTVGNDTIGGSLAALGYEAISLVLARLQGQSATGTSVGSSNSFTISRPNYAHYTDTPQKLAPQLNRFFAALRLGVIKVEAKALRPCSSVSGPSRSGVSTNDRRAGASLRQVFTIGAQRRHTKLEVAIAAIHFKALRMAAVGETPTKPPAGSLIEPQGDGVELVLRDIGEVGFSREVLPEQTVPLNAGLVPAVQCPRDRRNALTLLPSLPKLGLLC